jgi:coenzyme F420-dependent glucose-6-phosphate dehydrogenase
LIVASRIGYHASHEQFPPGQLLALVQHAERAGFGAAMCSDHFHPWSEVQGQSGHAWTWLGSAMATTALPYASVSAPVGRYHPAVVAQAIATLNAMHDDRYTLIAGSGEALNEAMTAKRWPGKPARNRRLRAAVDAMRALWRGEEVTMLERGLGFRVERARLYTLPDKTPKVFIAALSPQTAQWAAPWADGLVTISSEPQKLRRVLDAFREHGGDDKPAWLQVKLSWDTSESAAMAGAHAQWKTNVLSGDASEELRTPAQFEAAASRVREEDVRRAVRVSADLQRHVDWLQGDLAMGFERLMLHNVNLAQARFIDAFGERVLPEVH